MINNCEECGKSDRFRFDGQHMICECGTVLIREHLSDEEIARRDYEAQKKKEKELKRLKKKEERLRRERCALDGYYEKMPMIDEWCDSNDFFERDSVNTDHIDAMRYLLSQHEFQQKLIKPAEPREFMGLSTVIDKKMRDDRIRMVGFGGAGVMDDRQAIINNIALD